ncbi:MAG TPA: MFS transporter, partial [Mycobacterium sp.]|nr:MFS transporter [Mycobacterium sp.]
TVLATLSGLAAHRMVFGINTLLVLVTVRHTDSTTASAGGLGAAVLFVAATGTGSFLATVVTPAVVRRWGRYNTANAALGAAVVIQLCGLGLQVPVMVVCGFLLGAAGQVVKLCADSAMQIDVDDALRGHVFAVQDSLFWMAFIAATTAAAAVIPTDGHSPALVAAGSVVYLAGLGFHALVGRAGLR